MTSMELGVGVGVGQDQEGRPLEVVAEQRRLQAVADILRPVDGQAEGLETRAELAHRPGRPGAAVRSAAARPRPSSGRLPRRRTRRRPTRRPRARGPTARPGRPSAAGARPPAVSGPDRREPLGGRRPGAGPPGGAARAGRAATGARAGTARPPASGTGRGPGCRGARPPRPARRRPPWPGPRGSRARRRRGCAPPGTGGRAWPLRWRPAGRRDRSGPARPGSEPGGRAATATSTSQLALPLVEPAGGRLPGAVGVEGQHHPGGEAAEQLDVLLGQGRPAGGHGPLHPGLEEADDVGVALAHHHLLRLDDVLLGPVEGVQRAALGVDRASPSSSCTWPDRRCRAGPDRRGPPDGRRGRRWGTGRGPGRRPAGGPGG